MFIDYVKRVIFLRFWVVGMMLFLIYKLKLISEIIIVYGYMEYRVNFVDFNE